MVLVPVERAKEISIIIDTWDDVFSDFDPRPLSERVLSEDFVLELKKRYLETKRGNLIISFYAPKKLTDEKAEKIITHRIKQYFKLQALQKRREILAMVIRGASFVFMGVLFLLFLLYINYHKSFSELTIRSLEIIFMPLGWFGIWEGFSKIVDASPRHGQDERLFNKLSAAEYNFHYGD